MKIYKIFNINLILLLIITLLFFVAYPFINDFGKNIFRFFYVIATALLLLLNIRFSKINIIDFMSFLILIVISVLSALITNFEFSMENIYHLYSFIIFTFFIVACRNVRVDIKLLKFIYFFSVITAIIFLCYSQTSYAYWNGEQFVDRLTLGLYNANFAGMMILFVFGLIMITMKYYKYKFFSILLEIGLLYLLFLTNSRICIASAFFILIFSIFVGKIKIPTAVVMCICSIPFCFVNFYFYLSEYLGQDIIVMGRGIFNRGEIYTKFLSLIRNHIHFFVGNIGEGLLGNAHNAPLAIFVSIGLLGTLLYYFIIIKKLIVLNKFANSNVSKMAIVVILTCFIHSSGEAGCFLGIFPISVFVYVFFILAGTSNKYIK